MKSERSAGQVEFSSKESNPVKRIRFNPYNAFEYEQRSAGIRKFFLERVASPMEIITEQHFFKAVRSDSFTAEL